MIELRIFGQTPSKKTSQIMVLAKAKKDEKWLDDKAKDILGLCVDFEVSNKAEGKHEKAKDFIYNLIKNIPRGRPILLPNKKYMEWEKQAIFQLESQKEKLGLKTITTKVEVKCFIYRLTKRRVDKLNLEQSIHDVLQKAGIIENDYLIESTDGSRKILGVEKGEERVEIFVSRISPF